MVLAGVVVCFAGSWSGGRVGQAHRPTRSPVCVVAPRLPLRSCPAVISHPTINPTKGGKEANENGGRRAAGKELWDREEANSFPIQSGTGLVWFYFLQPFLHQSWPPQPASKGISSFFVALLRFCHLSNFACVARMPTIRRIFLLGPKPFIPYIPQAKS